MQHHGTARPRSFLVALVVGAAVTGGLALARLDARRQAAPPSSAPVVPRVYSNIAAGADGTLVFSDEDGATLPLMTRASGWTVRDARGTPSGTDKGLAFDFGRRDLSGTLVFGLVPFRDTRYPQTVFRSSTPIVEGKAQVDIVATISDRYDMVGWKQAGTGVLGYRIIAADGAMIHDGRIRFTGTGPFTTAATIVEGPFVSNVTSRSAVIWFELDRAVRCEVAVGRRVVPCEPGQRRQEIAVDGLAPGTAYRYEVRYDAYRDTYGFSTAPRAGTRRPFTFAWASDSRAGLGGGDRSVNGPNAYIVRRVMAAALDRRAAFVQFTGDLVSGYAASPGALEFELANWKAAIAPHAHWVPVYTAMGNHDTVVTGFGSPTGRRVLVDRHPFDTDSSEAVFARAMVNPENGPDSEDGSIWDPSPDANDFPTYRRNVYWYRHDNVAMVVLNSDYWYAPTLAATPRSGGNLHGYLMDNQLAWVGRTLTTLQRDATIDHVFITTHTPVFPNGGHVGDAMWYGGNNAPRPVVAGRPVVNGIIERRDDLLTLVQRHPKVLAVLTGDEHNYNRMRVTDAVPIYPAGWDQARVRIRRPFFQVNNGAAGAPYYAHDTSPPWSAAVRGFSTQNAVCFFHVDGPRVRLETINPETLEVLDRVVMR